MTTIQIALADKHEYHGREDISPKRFKVTLKCEDIYRLVEIEDPFDDIAEQNLRWYLEDYPALEPFEIGRAKKTAKSLTTYGHQLSKALVSSGLIPHEGHVSLDIELDSSGQGWNSHLHRLHWEILADTSKWPADYQLESITINRVMKGPYVPSRDGAGDAPTKLNILLVVCRPGGRNDINHQLVSKSATRLISRATDQSPDQASITILRPPTWAAFKKHLKDSAQGHYQLVHFDMHGVISPKGPGGARAALLFCKPHPRSLTEFQVDPRDGPEIVAELSRAGIRNVVLNACESGSNAYSDVNTNLARVFLEKGMSFVFAMSYKILEGAVEIFTNRFYQSLLRDQLDIAQAAETARHALLQDQGRRALFSVNVEIEDFMNLVIYRRADVSLFQLHKDKVTVTQEPFDVSSDFFPQNELYQSDLVGRDTQITELETLADALTQKIIVLTGQVGCGKTTLLRYCEWWWVHTGYVDAALHLKKPETSDPEFGMSYLLQEISRILKIECTDLSVEKIARLLKRRRVLIIFDGLERGNYNLSKNDQLALKDFIAKASQGKSLFILSARNRLTWEANDFIDPDYVASYRLPTLSIRDAIQYAEHLARQKQQDPGRAILRGKEALTYLERIVILLNQNPLAIKAVCSSDGALEDTRALFWSLLAGDDVLDRKTMLSPAFLTLSMELLSWRLQIASDKKILRRLYMPESLAFFWNVVPKDLRYFYYFSCIPFLNDLEIADLHKKKPLFAFMCQEDRDSALKSIENSGYSEFLLGTIDFLLKLGLLEDAVVQESNGRAWEAYHLTPIAKLLFQKDITEKAVPIFRSAFQKFMILQSRCFEKKHADITGVFWDGEKQHPDHAINLSLTATYFSLDGDMAEEIAQHGQSFADTLIGVLLLRNWGDARSAELANVMAKIQVLRLVMYMKMNPKGPDVGSLLHLAAIANALVEGGEPDGEGAVKAFFDLYPLWLRKGEKMPLLMEARCFDLRYAEAICVRIKKGSAAAKHLFERNLRIDPVCTPIDHSLYRENRRVQLKNLQEWVMGVEEIANSKGDYSLQNTELFNEHMPAILSEYAPGTYFDKVVKSRPPLESINPTYRDRYRNIIEREEATVKTFGILAHQILNEPMAHVFGEYLTMLNSSCNVNSGVAGDRFQRQAMIDTMVDVEMLFRLQARDWAGAKILLHRKIARETSNLSTAWRTLGNFHLTLHLIAIEEGDWETAKHHLDKRWDLFEGNHDTDPAFASEFHMAYAEVMDALEEPAEAGKCLLRAMGHIKGMKDDTVAYQCEYLAFKLKNLNLLLASSESVDHDAIQGKGKLSTDELEALKTLIANAMEVNELLKEVDRVEKELETRVKFAKELLPILQEVKKSFKKVEDGSEVTEI